MTSVKIISKNSSASTSPGKTEAAVLDQVLETSNKVMLAGIGAFAVTQAAVSSRVSQLVAEGETARGEYRDSFAALRKKLGNKTNELKAKLQKKYTENTPIDLDDVGSRISAAREGLMSRAQKFLPYPTQRDLDALSEKLDRILVKLAG